jgi:hypothetical protein
MHGQMTDYRCTTDTTTMQDENEYVCWNVVYM